MGKSLCSAMRKAMCGGVVALFCFSPVALAETSLPEEFNFPEKIEPVLLENCIRCHGNRQANGDLNIERIMYERPLVKHRELWLNIIARLEAKEMPPEEETRRPSEEEYALLEAWLDQSINHFDYSKVRDPGYESARRLTHTEYNHTIRDLFGLDLRPGDKFPSDLSGKSGFDNSANSLFIQTLLMEKYIYAADEVVETALPAEPKSAEDKDRIRRFLGEPPAPGGESVAASRALERFLLRAYRRPPSTEEVSELVELFEQQYAENPDYEGAVKSVLKTVLVSPNFLLKMEKPSQSAEEYAVDDFELASRLSYFLWASMPDDQLFELASAGKLHEPEVLQEQVGRMLADPKSLTLGDVFAAQWLGFEHLGTRVRLDPIDNPWCTDFLMDSMKAESSLFIHGLIVENRPLAELIDSDYTYLNDVVAELYGIEGVEGPEMRKVKVDTSQRGGVLGHGSIMATTSLRRRVSPTIRGKWVLTDLLGTPPPPPPPNVSQFSEEVRRNRRLSSRERLQMHSENPRCAACHSKIDPLGFGLENYDYFGQWRTHTRRGRQAIDASGTLPDGTTFNGPKELKTILVETRLDDLARQVTQKLLSYALGRQLEYYDEPAIRKIAAALEEADYGMQTLIYEIVDSYPFRFKKDLSSTMEGGLS